MTRQIPNRRHVGGLCAAVAALLLGGEAYGQRRFKPSEDDAPAQAEVAGTRKLAPKKTDDSIIAIVNGDVHVGTGQVLSRGQVLIKAGKIEAVGHDLEIPEEATVVDATNMVVCPGFVSVDDASVGRNSWRSRPGKSGLNPYDPAMKRALAAGITSFRTGSARGRGKPGGSTKIIKCSYGSLDGMILAENTVYGMGVPLDPKRWRDFEKLIQDTKKYAKDLEAYEQAALAAAAASGKGKKGEKKSDAPKKPKAPSGSGPLLSVMKGDAVLWISGARDKNSLEQAVQVSEAIGKGVVIDKCAIAWIAPQLIARSGSMAIVPPRQEQRPDPTNPEETGSQLATAAILNRAGVPVAVTSPPGGYGSGGIGTGGLLGQDLNTLHIEPAFAIRGGFPRREALRTITLDAARILGVDDRVGSLEVGKDADILICSGPPLHYATFAETVMVNGEVVYRRAEESYYKDIGRRPTEATPNGDSNEGSENGGSDKIGNGAPNGAGEAPKGPPSK